MPIQGRSRTGLFEQPVGGGIVADEVPQELSEPIFTDGLNVRFRDGYVQKTEGHDEVLMAPSGPALHVATLQTQNDNYFVHATASGLYADNGTTQTNITGTALTGSLGNKFTSTVASGGWLIVNNQVDVPQAWAGTGTAQALDAWPATYRCRSMRFYRDTLVAMNITKGTANYPSMIKTSHKAAPGFLPDSWDETDPTRDALERDLAETDDALVDGMALGNTFILYKERSAYGMLPLQNNSIFRTFRLPGSYGILSQNCVAETPKGHVVLTPGPDVVLHYANEPQSILQGRWRRWLEANIDTSSYANSFVVANLPKYEVWICIPTSGNTYCNRALVWNYEENTFSLIEIPNLTHATLGVYQTGATAWSAGTDTWADGSEIWDEYDVSTRLVASSGNSKLFLMDEGDTFNGTNISASVTRTGMHFGDPEIVKMFRGIVPRFNGDTGTVLSVEPAYSNDVEGSYTFGSAVTYTVGTSRKADLRVSGRFLGYRLSSSGAGTWRSKSIGLDVVAAGDR